MNEAKFVEYCNKQLRDRYGFASDNRSIFRIVWSTDQTEIRKIEYTESGIYLVNPRIERCKKYPWIEDKWILERLVEVPSMQVEEIPESPLSYEVLWVFQNNQEEKLPPNLDAALFVIDTLYAAMGKKSLVKYVDREKENPIEARHERIKKLKEDLFGNETEIGDALANKDGITVPSRYERDLPQSIDLQLGPSLEEKLS